MSVFKENLTSRLLQDKSLNLLNSTSRAPKNVLELGCGDGNITQFLINNQIIENNYYCSDISEEAVNLAKKNIKYSKLIFKQGSIFKPWKTVNIKFDIIISDVSSISEPVAKKSPWYDGITSDCDLDGIKNLKLIIKDLNKFINKDGFFIIPIISLCNLEKLYSILKENFIDISYSEKVNWPLPDFFKKNITDFQSLIDLNNINVEYKFGTYLAFTCIATCSKLKYVD